MPHPAASLGSAGRLAGHGVILGAIADDVIGSVYDSDTIGAITASIAHARYGVPEGIEREVRSRLSHDLLDINDRFCATFMRSWRRTG